MQGKKADSQKGFPRIGGDLTNGNFFQIFGQTTKIHFLVYEIWEALLDIFNCKHKKLINIMA